MKGRVGGERGAWVEVFVWGNVAALIIRLMGTGVAENSRGRGLQAAAVGHEHNGLAHSSHGVSQTACFSIPPSPPQIKFLSEALVRTRNSDGGGASGNSTPRSAPGMSIDEFEILKPISRGAFGRVYLARKHATKDLFAIKASAGPRWCWGSGCGENKLHVQLLN